MELKQIVSDVPFELVHNGFFKTYGFLQQRKVGLLSFIASPKYIQFLKNDALSSVVCTDNIVDQIRKERPDMGIIITEDPRSFLIALNERTMNKKFPSKIAVTANISKHAIVSEENVYIGNHVVIEDNVVIKSNTIIRDHVFIGSGTVLGGDSLMTYTKDGKQIITRHKGYLYIECDCMFMYNNTIDKGIFHGDITYIGKNSLVESNVTISHGCRLGERLVVASNSKICGYSNVGAQSYIGPNATVSNNLTLGEKCNVRIGSTVVENLAAQSDYSSPFAMPHQVNLMNRFQIMRKN